MQIEDVIKNKNEAIKILNDYLDTCIADDRHLKKANLISYWLRDYVRYIEEEAFKSEKLKLYKRGEIIKVNLGFNIGNEEGGLHYCVILDNVNARKYSTLTIIPLTSQKNNKNIPNSAILLGTEIYDKLSLKNKALRDNANKKCNEYKKALKEISQLPENSEDEKNMKNVKTNNIKGKIELLNKEYTILKRM